MKNKLIFCFIIFLTLCVSLTLVSASENVTDDIAQEDVSQEEVPQEAEDIDVNEDLGVSDETEDTGEVLSKDATSEVVSTNSTPSTTKTNTASNTKTVKKTNSKISTSKKVVGYAKFPTKLTFTLKSGGKALASKKITIVINKVKYTKKTDKKGKVTLKVKLKYGKYNVKYSYAGDAKTNKFKGASKLIMKKTYKTHFKIGDKDINYRHGSKCLFYVKLIDERNKAVKGQKVKFKVAGKTYTAKTNSKGNAIIFLKLKKGNHKIKFSFSKKAPYFASSGSYKIKVKPSMGKGNGYWLWSSHMNSVSLKSLASKGTKHILLHVHSIAVHGKSAVTSFIKRAHGYGMKVHLWMQVCYSNGKWVRPVNPDGSLKYGFMNQKIAEAKRYAKIPGVDGVHFDYIRFGGTAHLYKTSVKAINYFSKKASVQIHKIRPNCIVSAAVMPEPKMMHYYYGQDIPTMSKYMDVIIPMAYKGNYHQPTKWIKSVTKTFVKQSNGAQFWAGLQSYHSDNNAKKLSQSTLVKDARAAKAGGAVGAILFRIGISINFNFKKV